MPFQSVPNTLSVETRFTLYGEQCENTFYVEVPGGYSFEDVGAIADIFAGWITASWAERFTAAVQFTEVYVKGLENLSDLETSVFFTGGQPGRATGTSAPGNVTLAVKRSAGFTGRSRKGRIFLPALALAAITGNRYSDVSIGYIIADLEALNAELLADGFVPVIVSRTDVAVPSGNARTFAITQWTVTDNEIDSQRRRLGGRGT